ncbi:hypothetical protein D3C87_1771410 [compost metagenome]
MAAVENGERHMLALLRLQVNIPVCGKQRFEAEMPGIERRRPCDVLGHDDGIIADCFHLFSSVEIQDTFSLYVFL